MTSELIHDETCFDQVKGILEAEFGEISEELHNKMKSVFPWDLVDQFPEKTREAFVEISVVAISDAYSRLGSKGDLNKNHIRLARTIISSDIKAIQSYPENWRKKKRKLRDRMTKEHSITISNTCPYCSA
ncbi:MAG: hypothetical protein AB3N15_17010 [Paracoccaceae bacterium]